MRLDVGLRCTTFPHVKAEKTSFVGTSVTAYLRPDLARGSQVVAALTHPIARLMETLRLWPVSERQARASEPVDDAKTPDPHHERNTSL
jgi:hypothetical protein